MNEWMNEGRKEGRKEWRNEWMNEGMKEGMKEWRKEWMNPCACYLRGYCTPNLKPTCFVCYLKIINLSLRNNASKELKNGIEILVQQVIFKLWIETVKIIFWSITQEPLGLLKILMTFLSFLDNLQKGAYIIFHKGGDNFEKKAQNMLVFG